MTKLSINDIQAAATSVNISPDSFTDVPFDITSGLQGNNRCVVSFSDFPISFDNEFFFALNYTSRLNILEIKTNPQPTFVEKVFGNKDVFSFRSFRTSNLNYSLLGDADLVVLNGIDKIDDALSNAINSYRNNYGALFVVPGTQPDVNSYQKIVPLPFSLSTEAEMSKLDNPDFKNPFFANVFEERSSSLAMPDARRLLDWGADRSAILKFKNGRPFLSQTGKTFVLTSPLEKRVYGFL